MEPLPVLPANSTVDQLDQSNKTDTPKATDSDVSSNSTLKNGKEKETAPFKRSQSEIADKAGPMNKILIPSQSFPSLSDHVLRQLGLWLEENKTTVVSDTEKQSEKEVENNFSALVLAFQTDRLTLTSRLELQNRLRDQAEQNMANEIQQLQNTVTKFCERMDHLDDLKTQMDTLQKAALRVSSAAELYGAVQQENRLSKAVDVILRHVENLKQAYHKEKTEHVETKKVLSENKSPTTTEPVIIKPNCRRRATIAVGVAQNGTHLPDTSEVNLDGKPMLATGRSRQSRFSLTPRDSFGKLEAIQRRESLTDCLVENRIERRLSFTGSLISTCSVESGCSHYRCNSINHDSDIGEDSDGSVEDQPVAQTFSNVCQGFRFPIEWSSISKCSTQQLILHVRYGIAAILLVAAVAVFCSSLYL